jgi:hypothetical protein
MKKLIFCALSVILVLTAQGQQQVDSVTVKKVLKLNGKRVLGISNDTTATSKDSVKLITEGASKRYADIITSELTARVLDSLGDVQDRIQSKVPSTRTVNGIALSSNITISKSDIGLGNVDNTSDANKPVSTAQQTALNQKTNNTDTAAMLEGYLREGHLPPSTVSLSGSNGIDVTGTSPGNSFSLTLGNITPTSVSASGTVTGTNLAGTITTASQPNITTVGTLTSLNVTGNTVTGAVISNTISSTSGSNLNLNGGTFIVANRAITAPDIIVTNEVSTNTLVANGITGTLLTSAQSNITSVGTLSGLSVSGNSYIGGNISAPGLSTVSDSSAYKPIVSNGTTLARMSSWPSTGGGGGGGPLTIASSGYTTGISTTSITNGTPFTIVTYNVGPTDELITFWANLFFTTSSGGTWSSQIEYVSALSNTLRQWTLNTPTFNGVGPHTTFNVMVYAKANSTIAFKLFPTSGTHALILDLLYVFGKLTL